MSSNWAHDTESIAETKPHSKSHVHQLSNALMNVQNDWKVRENDPILSTCPPSPPYGWIGHLRLRQNPGQSTKSKQDLKATHISVRMHPWTSRTTKIWGRTNLVNPTPLLFFLCFRIFHFHVGGNYLKSGGCCWDVVAMVLMVVVRKECGSTQRVCVTKMTEAIIGHTT